MDHDHYYDHHLDHLCLWSVPTSYKGLGQTVETSGIARVGICLFAWGLMTLSAHIGYIAP